MFAFLNDGAVLNFFDELTNKTTYLFGAAEIIFIKSGFNELQLSPVVHSVTMQLTLDIGAPPQYVGDLFEEFPEAIRIFEISVLPSGGGPTEIPNPIKFEPKNYLFEL